jgi:5'-3' exonuclease
LLRATGYFAVCVAVSEADHTLRQLAADGVAQAIISKDSDMLPHLACAEGALWLSNYPRLHVAVQPAQAQALLFPGLPCAFVWLFCLAGCDYFSGIQGIGYKTAKKILQSLSHRVLDEHIDFGELKVRVASFDHFGVHYKIFGRAGWGTSSAGVDCRIEVCESSRTNRSPR